MAESEAVYYAKSIGDKTDGSISAVEKNFMAIGYGDRHDGIR